MNIACLGSEITPTNMWSWIVCSDSELEELAKQGYAKSECTKYLSNAQIKLLNSKEE